MTLFAFYYVGIGAAVFLLGYFQVGLEIFVFQSLSSKFGAVIFVTSNRVN